MRRWNLTMFAGLTLLGFSATSVDAHGDHGKAESRPVVKAKTSQPASGQTTKAAPVAPKNTPTVKKTAAKKKAPANTKTAAPTSRPVQKIAEAPRYPNVSFQVTPAGIKKTCQDALTDAQSALTNLLARNAKLPSPSFFYTFVPFDTIVAEFDQKIGVPYLLKYTSPDKKIRKAGQFCLRTYFGFTSRLFARSDLYKMLKRASQSGEKLDATDTQLQRKILKEFERSGAAFPPAKSKEIAQLNAKISKLRLKFQTHLNEDKTVLALTQDELKGVPKSSLAGLKKDKQGRYLLRPIIASKVIAVYKNAVNPATRKKVLDARQGIQSEANKIVLQEIIQLRHRLAQKLGYKTYAHYVLDERMAKTPEAVKAFLLGLRKKLRQKMDQELATLLELKKKDEPKATQVFAWDWRFYANQLKKTKYAVNDEEIRQYFPMDHVIKEVFTIYQRLLGVSFREIKPARAWHPDVRLFSIRDKRTKQHIAHFYLDLYPRPGKYSHFAAFGFQSGRRLMNGTYRPPVSAVVGNWQKPAPGKPALLSHSEVETFFHEFGHIMHQTLTTGRYSSLSGTSVKRDFVEAPSQMLENWVWKPKVLKTLSKHHKTGKPLSDKLIQKMLAAKHLHSGLFWTRQLFFATVDMTYHTLGEKVDTGKVWQQVTQEVMPVAKNQGGHPASTFGHLMGYAAGYYGYLWSKVYAQDMFTLFEAKGLLSPKAGMHYRKWILEPGGTRDPATLIQGFLGRKPKADAFYKELGIQ